MHVYRDLRYNKSILTFQYDFHFLYVGDSCKAQRSMKLVSQFWSNCIVKFRNFLEDNILKKL